MTHDATLARARGASATAVNLRRPMYDRPWRQRDSDDDNDVATPRSVDHGDNAPVLRDGRAATGGEQRAIAAVMKRYYAAALREDGASGCGMIYTPLASSVPEDYVEQFGIGNRRGGKTCAAIVANAFERFHTQLAAEVPRLHVLAVRIAGRQGRVLLGFGRLPERELNVVREGGAWKVLALLDHELP